MSVLIKVMRMTNEEAISKIKAILEEATETEDAVCYVTSVDAESLNLAIEALEKQIPKKPKMPLDAYWTCPICGRKVDPFEHCTSCGQVIDWSEKNDRT